MDALGRLVESLALGDGFQVALLIVGGPDDADRAIGALQRRLSAQIERPTLVLRLTPPVVEAGISADALAESLIGPLPGPAEAAVVVLDGSGSTNRDEPAWAELFRRLNARRNGLGRQLGRPLVLCLTPTLETLLAQQAPDLWSIRSARADVREERRASTSLAVRQAPAAREEGLRYEEAVQAGLEDELERIYPDPRAGLGLLAEIGFPPARLPLGDAPDFWARVLRELDRGVAPGGLALFVRRLAQEYPGNAVLDGLRARARGRTRVDPGWVRANNPWTEQSLIVDAPAVDELVQLLKGEKGVVIALIGAEGSGRRLVLKAARDRLAREGWFVLRLSERGIVQTAQLEQLAGWVTPVDAAVGDTLRALAARATPPAEVLARLPSPLRARLHQDPIAPPSTEFVGESVVFAVGRLSSRCVLLCPITLPNRRADLPDALFFRSLRLRTGAVGLGALANQFTIVARVEPWAQSLIAPDVQHVLLLPPADPSHLMAILARRLEAASQADRLALDDLEMQDIFHRLASITGNPGAFLAWVQAMLSRWPVPPPPEWREPVSLARIAWPHAHPKLTDEDLLALGWQLDGGPLSPEELSAKLSLPVGAKELVETGLLTRADDDPSRLTLSPVAQLLRPSVQARLRDQS